MALKIFYEIYSFKNGNWTVDSVHDDKEVAINLARSLLESRHHMSVKVTEESYDDATDNSTSQVVFNKRKRDEPPKSADKKREEKKKKAEPDIKKKEEPVRTSGSHTLIKITLSVGGIALGLISLLTFMILTFE